MRVEKKSDEEFKLALAELFPRLWRYCVSVTGNRDTANDLAQSACLRAIEKAELFEPGTRLDRWLFTIAQRLWINEWRARTIREGKGLVPIEELEIADTKPNQESNIFAREVFREVMDLPEAQRSAVIIVYVEGFSYKEASEILEIPIGTVMSRLASARTKIKGRFEFDDDGGRTENG